MKLLILALDAMAPNVLFKHLDKFPTFKKLTEQGAYGKLGTILLPVEDYLKQGLSLEKAKEEKRGYASIGCWYSFYTGLHPKTLNVKDEYIRSIVKGKTFKWGEHVPDVENKNLFLWHKLNKNGLSFGIINGFFVKQEPINGFMSSSGGVKHESSYYPVKLNDVIPKYEFKSEYPKDAEELSIIKLSTEKGKATGFNKEDLEKLRNAKDRILEKLPGKYWGNKLEQIKYERKYYLKVIEKIFSKIKTDVLMFFTLNLDSLQHFQWHEKGIKTIIEAYQEYDKFCAALIERYNPENILILSDHGAEPYADSNVMKEHYIKVNDNLVLTGETPLLGMVSGKHSLTGIFILKGPKVKKNCKVKNANLLDMHPTLLKALNINSPEKTEGKVLEQIFIS